MKFKKVGIFSLAKFQSILFAMLGMVAGIIYSFGGFVVDTLVSLGCFTTSETPGLSAGTLLAFGALLGMPIIFSVFGFMLCIIEALLFNQFAKWFGGINFETKP